MPSKTMSALNNLYDNLKIMSITQISCFLRGKVLLLLYCHFFNVIIVIVIIIIAIIDYFKKMIYLFAFFSDC